MRMRLSSRATAAPAPRPIAAPSVICNTNMGSRLGHAASGVVNIWSRPMVRKMAIGSLLPDSSSSRGRRLPLRRTPRERSTANTAAASVDETIAASSRLSTSEKSSTSQMNRPSKAAVTATPRVERISPCRSTPRILRQFVSRPPENRI